MKTAEGTNFYPIFFLPAWALSSSPHCAHLSPPGHGQQLWPVPEVRGQPLGLSGGKEKEERLYFYSC